MLLWFGIFQRAGWGETVFSSSWFIPVLFQGTVIFLWCTWINVAYEPVIKHAGLEEPGKEQSCLILCVHEQGQAQLRALGQSSQLRELPGHGTGSSLTATIQLRRLGKGTVTALGSGHQSAFVPQYRRTLSPV